MSGTANADQKTFWTETVGTDWVANQRDMDLLLAPAARAVLDEAKIERGARVLDIGCGTGALTRAAAQAAGAEGHVVGLDISATMLAHAASLEQLDGAASISWLETDAQTHEFGVEAFDFIISRFGVMFFADPLAAFANLRGAAAKGGRFVAICWRGPQDSPYFRLMQEALFTVTGGGPPAVDPHAPGPMAFADDARVIDLMSRAGWDAHALRIKIDLEPSGGIDRFLEQVLAIGPIASALKSGSLDRSDIPKVQSVLRDLLAPMTIAGGRLVVPNDFNLFVGRA